MLPHNVGTGLCQGMIPLIAYNYSSGSYRRMTKRIRTARTYGLMFTFLCIIVFEVFAAGVFAGHGIYVFWDYKTHSDLYAAQSAPWYTSILVYGIFTIVILIAAIIIKLIIRRILKQ